ncbi:MAG: 2-hydroxyacyl-CoA dehydratase, partial [Proteobacteria bacterium]|nr:2-hydroxyacyl-CoA dehydratase [Pseudomonadota bacterium]
FKENNSCVVASTYCNSWVFTDFNPEFPLESMAKAYLGIFINRNDKFKEGYMKKIISDYSIDGIVFHNAKTCPNNSNSQYNLPNRMEDDNVRSVVIDGDLCDLRCLSEEQSVTIIEAFLETL